MAFLQSGLREDVIIHVWSFDYVWPAQTQSKPICEPGETWWSLEHSVHTLQASRDDKLGMRRQLKRYEESRLNHLHKNSNGSTNHHPHPETRHCQSAIKHPELTWELQQCICIGTVMVTDMISTVLGNLRPFHKCLGTENDDEHLHNKALRTKFPEQGICK